MKILHIDLVEYDSLEALSKGFFSMDEEMKKNGIQLYSTKEKAEKALRYQFNKYNKLGSRIFWYARKKFENKIYYILYEVIFD